MPVIHFDYPEAFYFLMKNKEVYTLRPYAKPDGRYELESKLTLDKIDTPVYIMLIKMVKKIDDLKDYVRKSGYGSIEAWVKAAHGSPFLHNVRLITS